MNPSEKIKHIKDIASKLSQEEWSVIDLTLKEFGFPWSDQWNGDRESYVVEMISNAEEGKLLEIAKHMGVISQLKTEHKPMFWKEDDVRIFLSHLSNIKTQAKELRNALESYGIKAFVAHEDIEPTKEWQIEIESALSTMDGLVALLSLGFKESNWCDQEVGIAIGRRVPIISVRLGLDPYGFIGKYQGLQGAEKDPNTLANKLFAILIESPIVGQKITGVLVQQLEDSSSFAESKRLINLIGRSKYLTSKHADMLKDAIENNNQVRSSYGVPKKIDQIVKRVRA